MAEKENPPDHSEGLLLLANNRYVVYTTSNVRLTGCGCMGDVRKGSRVWVDNRYRICDFPSLEDVRYGVGTVHVSVVNFNG